MLAHENKCILDLIMRPPIADFVMATVELCFAEFPLNFSKIGMISPLFYSSSFASSKQELLAIYLHRELGCQIY